MSGFKYKRGERDIKQDEFYHIHKCEIEMIEHYKVAKCPYKVKRKDMSWHDKCDYCSHLRIVSLNSKGNVITGLNEIREEDFK